MSLEADILRAVSTIGQASVASALAKNPSTVSRMFAGETGITISDLEVFLGVLGMKVVPLDAVTVDPQEHQMLVEIAARTYAAQAEALRKRAESSPPARVSNAGLRAAP